MNKVTIKDFLSSIVARILPSSYFICRFKTSFGTIGLICNKQTEVQEYKKWMTEEEANTPIILKNENNILRINKSEAYELSYEHINGMKCLWLPVGIFFKQSLSMRHPLFILGLLYILFMLLQIICIGDLDYSTILDTHACFKVIRFIYIIFVGYKAGRQWEVSYNNYIASKEFEGIPVCYYLLIAIISPYIFSGVYYLLFLVYRQLCG